MGDRNHPFKVAFPSIPKCPAHFGGMPHGYLLRDCCRRPTFDPTWGRFRNRSGSFGHPIPSQPRTGLPHTTGGNEPLPRSLSLRQTHLRSRSRRYPRSHSLSHQRAPRHFFPSAHDVPTEAHGINRRNPIQTTNGRVI